MLDDAENLMYEGAVEFQSDETNGSAFGYNANGDLITDTGKGIMFIEYGTKNGNIMIKFTNGYFDQELYNLYNLQGTLLHENLHKFDQDNKKEYADKDVRHSEIIISEMSSPYFSKGTESYRNGQIGQLQYYMQKVLDNEDIDIKTQIFDLLIEANKVLQPFGERLKIQGGQIISK